MTEIPRYPSTETERKFCSTTGQSVRYIVLPWSVRELFLYTLTVVISRTETVILSWRVGAYHKRLLVAISHEMQQMNRQIIELGVCLGVWAPSRECQVLSMILDSFLGYNN
jgi:hypothetical protein